MLRIGISVLADVLAVLIIMGLMVKGSAIILGSTM